MHVVIFVNDTATTEIYTLSLHDALPISGGRPLVEPLRELGIGLHALGAQLAFQLVNPHRIPLSASRDRKSTRLNSSHANISYAVFCLKKQRKAFSSLPCCRLPCASYSRA